ncbi:Acetoin utilization deacetylase AcuC [Poseidonocella pacifica]|uniref:Acetoin utilization deacetylase AcuC n=1 Tax=Poseidonocella pacifica TaxID=871651 RepID=A0A1I0VHH9_9RHOB|nr:histone deacetylase family protein [Poseidonocella pacifica]SFA75390.1 Acetoin utilization deacetylase AcuC [Poseidonocella pacifica]
MQGFYDERQTAHDPKFYLRAGRQIPSPEQPARAAALKAGAEAAGVRFASPPDAGIGPIAAVHTSEYLHFLQTIHARWTAMPNASAEVIPNIHPARRTDSYPSAPVGLAGYHQADTSCVITAQTWSSAYWSAQTAIAAADAVSAEGPVYALCRPPGHHCFTDLAGGFCYLNNAAIAAERLRAKGKRVAILDIDVHHGNGTQGIFYARGDVLTVSIHADPEGFYPFFWGHAQERGEGAGLGANLNLPLVMGSDTAAFLGALDHALKRIAAFGPDVLVIAAGLDAHEEDPFQGLKVTTEGFTEIGARIAQAGYPTLLVQEGGYLSDALSRNLTALLGGFGT